MFHKKKYFNFFKFLFICFILGSILFIVVTNYFCISFFQQFNNEISNEITVYSTQVDNESDCTSEEKFNNKTKSCEFECKGEVACKTILDKIDQEIDSLSKESVKNEVSGKESKILAEYIVFNTQIKLINGNDAYQELWMDITSLAPVSLINDYIEKFIVYSEDSDTAAYVIDEDNNGKWNIAVNLNEHTNGTSKEQKATIIHELAHIITLNNKQLDQKVEQCNTYQADEGCSLDQSYINKFVASFWQDLNQKYNESSFVSEYAATNPEEDIAESFADYVFTSKIEGDDTKSNKLRFFEQFDELVLIKKNMRALLSYEIYGENR